jgi:hypothetical protein
LKELAYITCIIELTGSERIELKNTRYRQLFVHLLTLLNEFESLSIVPVGDDEVANNRFSLSSYYTTRVKTVFSNECERQAQTISRNMIGFLISQDATMFSLDASEGNSINVLIFHLRCLFDRLLEVLSLVAKCRYRLLNFQNMDVNELKQVM